jgi:hypothetical protein
MSWEDAMGENKQKGRAIQISKQSAHVSGKGTKQNKEISPSHIAVKGKGANPFLVKHRTKIQGNGSNKTNRKCI